MTRMGTGCVMVENLFRGHPPEKSGLEQEEQWVQSTMPLLSLFDPVVFLGSVTFQHSACLLLLGFR